MLAGGLFLLAGIVLLWLGADLLVRNSARLADSFGIPKLVIGLTLVAFGTSAPELVVSLLAALQDAPDLSVGNIVGSNLFNTLVILAAAALYRPVPVNVRILRVDAPVMLFFTVMMVLLGWDGQLSRWEGGALLLCFLGYTALLFRQRRDMEVSPLEGPASPVDAPAPRRLRWGFLCAVGLGGLCLGGEATIRGAVRLAAVLGIPEVIIGLTVVAAGTSLPELFTSVVAMVRREADISLGNIVGSNIFNIGLILSGAALVRPLKVSIHLQAVDLWVLLGATVATVVVFYARRAVGRMAGAGMLGFYLIYVYWLFARIAR